MKRDPVIILVVATVVTVMLVFGFRMARRNPGQRAGSGQAGQTAPDFALQSLEGKTVHLSDFRGKAVLLNFWATWCGPCKIEMPWFVDLQNKYRAQGLQVVGVSFDDDSTPEEVGKFTKEMGVNYPILMGKESVERDYGGVQVLPITLYIDRDGRIVDKVFGLRGRGEIEENIKRALAEGGTTQAGK